MVVAACSTARQAEATSTASGASPALASPMPPVAECVDTVLAGRTKKSSSGMAELDKLTACLHSKQTSMVSCCECVVPHFLDGLDGLWSHASVPSNYNLSQPLQQACLWLMQVEELSCDSACVRLVTHVSSRSPAGPQRSTHDARSAPRTRRAHDHLRQCACKHARSTARTS